MSDNPYASPATPDVIEESWDPNELPIASQNRRFLNFIIDGIITQILSMAGGFVIGFLYAMMKAAAGQPITAADQNMMQVVGFFVGLAVSLAYFVFMETLFRRTLGKFITGTYVVTADGQTPSLGQIVGRSFARFIPFEPFSFLIGTHPVGWHDSLSRTRVVTRR